MLAKREPVPLLQSSHVSPAVSTNYALQDIPNSFAIIHVFVCFACASAHAKHTKTCITILPFQIMACEENARYFIDARSGVFW